MTLLDVGRQRHGLKVLAHLAELVEGEGPEHGADRAMDRVGAFIKKNKDRINNLHVTLRCHQDVHITHPIFWKTQTTGRHPRPLTQITAGDLHAGVWTTAKPSLSQYGIRYVEALIERGSQPLTIFPPHCLTGTVGHSLYAPIAEACREYVSQFATINFVATGSNPFVEFRSALGAEVDPVAVWCSMKPGSVFETDPSVMLNVPLLEALYRADKVLVCGQPGSHRVAKTIRDAVAFFPGNSFAKKLVLLMDGTSPLAGFVPLQDQFIDEMTARGMEIATTDSFLF